MAVLGVEDTQLHGYLGVVLHKKRRTDGDILHVIGTQLDLD
jgi:hypothetical protein